MEPAHRGNGPQALLSVFMWVKDLQLTESLGGLASKICDVQALSSEVVADVPQWLLESSSGEAASLAKQVATAAIILKTVSRQAPFLKVTVHQQKYPVACVSVSICDGRTSSDTHKGY